MKGLKVSRLLALLALLSVPVLLVAQSTNGVISGTITDSTGAVVSGATIDVTSKATGHTLTVTSGGGGDYVVNALKPGQYQVQVKAANFASVTQDVTLQISQTLPLNFALNPGAVTENVVVTTEAPLVATQTSDLGDVITGRQVVDLPLNSRNFTQLATLVPGVTRGSNTVGDATGGNGNAETYRYNSSGGAALVVNGLRPQANNFLLDGFDNNESLVNTIVFFSAPDAIQEFRVETNVAPAEFGRAGGGIINAGIKSGTNQWHGTLWEFFRNSALDATPWQPQQNAKKPFVPPKSIRRGSRWPDFQGQAVRLRGLPGIPRFGTRQHGLRDGSDRSDAQQWLHQLLGTAGRGDSHYESSNGSGVPGQHHYHSAESGGG